MLRQGTPGTEMGPVDREVTTPGKGKGGKEAQVLRDRRLKAEFLIWLTLHETVEDAETQQGGWGELSPGGGKNTSHQHCGRQGLFKPVVSM